MTLPIVGTVGALLLAAGAVLSTSAAHEDSQGASAPEVSQSTSVGYTWPTGEPARVVRGFDAPGERWAPGHRGVDLGLAAGAPVVSAADGVVAFAGSVAGRGVISVLHGDGLRTTYEPVVAAVRQGDLVRAGEPIGTLAAAQGHCAPASCLHWGARGGPGDYRDPLLLLRAGAVIRLYPDS
jgi:murein DD-endopeptidase MepM/ murein hydrolase activator NlpD